MCEAFYKCAISVYKNEIFNLGTGKPKKINELVKILKSKIINIPWRPGEPKKTEADINKISRILKWKPTIDLKEGINLVLKNINYWKKAPLWTRKSIKNATQNWQKYLK